MKKLLGQSAFWVINKDLAKKLGSIDCALLLSDLLDKQEYFTDKVDDKWFFNTRENIQNDTSLSPDRQRSCIKILCDLGIMETREMGLPKKTYYYINTDVLADIMLGDTADKYVGNPTTSRGKIPPLDGAKSNDILYNKNKEKNNKINNTIITTFSSDGKALSLPDELNILFANRNLIDDKLKIPKAKVITDKAKQKYAALRKTFDLETIMEGFGKYMEAVKNKKPGETRYNHRYSFSEFIANGYGLERYAS